MTEFDCKCDCKHNLTLFLIIYNKFEMEIECMYVQSMCIQYMYIKYVYTICVYNMCQL